MTCSKLQCILTISNYELWYDGGIPIRYSNYISLPPFYHEIFLISEISTILNFWKKDEKYFQKLYSIEYLFGRLYNTIILYSSDVRQECPYDGKHLKYLEK